MKKELRESVLRPYQACLIRFISKKIIRNLLVRICYLKNKERLKEIKSIKSSTNVLNKNFIFWETVVYCSPKWKSKDFSSRTDLDIYEQYNFGRKFVNLSGLYFLPV